MREQLLLAVVWAASSVVGRPLGGQPKDGRPSLSFASDGSFQISVFNDLHFGEGEDNPPEAGWGPISDQRSTVVMNTILDSEAPQLVVLNGDLITGENTYKENSTAYLDIIVDPLVRRNIKWASTYGNHDRDLNLSSTDLLAQEQKYQGLSMTKSMVGGEPEVGVTNYYLPVYKAGSFTPALLLWFFDSRGGQHYQQTDQNGNRIGYPSNVHDAVTQWFTSTNAALQQHYGGPIPSLAFVHIPVNAMAAFQTQGVDPNREPGINDDNPLAMQGLENEQYNGADIPFMSALLQTKGLMAVFSGHDHGDDWCNKWDSQLPGMTLVGNGLFFCFGRHSGYGGYGTWMRGSRQIKVQLDSLGKAVQTWNRMEDGSVSGAVVLNASYGTDTYPAVENKHTHQ